MRALQSGFQQEVGTASAWRGRSLGYPAADARDGGVCLVAGCGPAHSGILSSEAVLSSQKVVWNHVHHVCGCRRLSRRGWRGEAGVCA